LNAKSNWSGPDNLAIGSDWNFKIGEKKVLVDLQVNRKMVGAFDKCAVQADIFNGVFLRPVQSTIFGNNVAGNSRL
jgi:hypothetical protein